MTIIIVYYLLLGCWTSEHLKTGDTIRMYRTLNSAVFSIFIIGALLISLSPLRASSAALSLDYSLGFDGYFQLKAWTPLTVMLENRGRAISGTLEVIVTSGSEYRRDIHETTYSLDVELPYNSTKLCSFTILITSFTHDLIMRFRQDGKIIHSNSLNLRSHYTTKDLAVVVDEKTSPDFLSALPQRLFPVNVRPRFLPETWYGYNGVSMIVIPAEMLKKLRDRQFQALVQWVKQGGFLITAGGINYGSLLEKRMMRLLPIKILGHKQFFALRSLEDFCGQPLESSDAFLVLHVNIEHSDVLFTERDIPIITQKNLKAGKMIFLSFDYQNPPFSRWVYRQSFWNALFSLRTETDQANITLDTQKTLKTLLANMPAGFPNTILTFIFLGIYMLLLRLVFKRIEKRKYHKWKDGRYLLVIIAVFSIASHGIFFYGNDKKNLTYNSVFHLQPIGQKGMALGNYSIGIYSIEKTEYTLDFGSSPNPITHLLSEISNKKTPGIYVLHEQNSIQQIKGISSKWSHNFFAVNSTLEFPLMSQAHLDAQRLRITIENMTPYKIMDCWGYFDSRLFFLGDIWPDNTQTKTITTTTLKNRNFFDYRDADQVMHTFETTDLSSSLKTIQKELIKEILPAVHSIYQSRQDTLYVIGWIQSDIMKANFTSPGIIGEHLTLISWEIPIT